MNPCFASDRRAIIFSHDKTFWTEKFANERSDISHVSVVPPVIDFYKTPYTGCEALSVLVIVDHMLEAKHDTEMFIILNLAITRAQFEVMIIVKEKYRNRMEKFIRIPSRLDRILMHAGNQLPVDLTFLKTVEWTKDMTSFVQKLTRIAIQRSDERLLGSILDKVPAFRIPLGRPSLINHSPSNQALSKIQEFLDKDKKCSLKIRSIFFSPQVSGNS